MSPALRFSVPACVLCLLIAGQSSLAGDIWNWDEPWEPADTATAEDDPVFPEIPEGVFELPRKILSLQTHGSYFGSGDEFLLGGAQVFGIGGARHVSDHSLNLPAAALSPEIARLLGSSDSVFGPMWGRGDRRPDEPAGADDSGADQGTDDGAGSKSKIRWLRYED